jgi:transcriptional regulator with XRE-family HTH domain
MCGMLAESGRRAVFEEMLRAVRQSASMTQGELAAIARISTSYIPLIRATALRTENTIPLIPSLRMIVEHAVSPGRELDD